MEMCKEHKEIKMKKCSKCGRELPIDIKYFPPDKMCKDGLRNVCRECGKDGHFMKEGYIPKKWWTPEENKLFIERYPNYTSEELILLFYPDETMKSLSDKAYKLGCGYKTDETKIRANIHKRIVLSEKLLGHAISEDTKRKLSETMKKLYASGKLTSHWVGRVVTEEERKRISERQKEKWSGENNPRHINPLKGELNGRWKGGIKPIYFYLRDYIKDWKKDSMKAYNYKCALTGLNFDNIHHLIPFKDIVDEVFFSLNLDIRTSLGDYSNEELNEIEQKLIELHNKYGLGVPLCKELHKLFHDTYGYTKTTKEMFTLFEEKYYKGEFDNLLDDKYKFNKAIKRVKRVS